MSKKMWLVLGIVVVVVVAGIVVMTLGNGIGTFIGGGSQSMTSGVSETDLLKAVGAVDSNGKLPQGTSFVVVSYAIATAFPEAGTKAAAWRFDGISPAPNSVSSEQITVRASDSSALARWAKASWENKSAAKAPVLSAHGISGTMPAEFKMVVTIAKWTSEIYPSASNLQFPEPWPELWAGEYITLGQGGGSPPLASPRYVHMPDCVYEYDEWAK